jgi:hypothetical protein
MAQLPELSDQGAWLESRRKGNTKETMAKVKHIALIKFKEGTSEEQITQLFDELLDITEDIPGIEDYVSGTNSSPEGLSQGYTHGLIMTFSDAAARDAYLQHPEQGRVQALITPHAESSVVFDFEV